LRLLVIGGWGQLGTDIALAADQRHELIRPRHAELDVTDARSTERVISETKPDVVLNAAAFHKVELCEQDPDRAFGTNAVGAENVARAARKAGARSVFISTDYVFDGERPDGYTEEDPVGPLNAYGSSKAAGEAAVRTADPSSLVVRGSGMFGHAGSAGKGGNFVDNMIERAKAGATLTVVDDQVFAPTATRDMAERLLLLIEQSAPPGIYHAANAGRCSWYELARRAIELSGLKADIRPTRTVEGAVRRPVSSVLLDTKSTRLGLPANRAWEDALAWYLANRPAATAAPGLTD
jgi:dTDP-4-dehydrorhamnose reductase